jgi:nucleoside-diphosphate-sugar epimerase
MKKLLITGASGKLGSSLMEGLKEQGIYEIVAADLHHDPAG